jgi:hypothetical protein
MRIVEQSTDRLVFHDSPWGLRGIGTLFSLSGTGLLALMIWGGHSGEHNAWVAVVVGTMFAAIGLAIALTAADRRVVFDRALKVARLIRSGGVLHAQLTEMPFASIRDIALESSSTGSSGNSRSSMYRIVFVLRDGSRVPWTSVLTGDMGTQARCVGVARAFGGWDAAAARSGAATTEVARPTPPPGVPVTSASPPPSALPGSSLAQSTGIQNVGFVIAFLAIFSLVGVGLMAMQVERLLLWRPVPATVQAATIDAVHGNKGGTSYRPIVTYAYLVGGRAYSSTSVTVINVSRSRSWAVGIVSRYPVGSRTTAYIDPSAPAHAYLVHEVSLLPLLFVAIPFVFGAIVVLSARWSTRQAELAAAVPVPVVASATFPSSRAA